jgi:hypothetical protein
VPLRVPCFNPEVKLTPAGRVPLRVTESIVTPPTVHDPAVPAVKLVALAVVNTDDHYVRRRRDIDGPKGIEGSGIDERGVRLGIGPRRHRWTDYRQIGQQRHDRHHLHGGDHHRLEKEALPEPAEPTGSACRS